jgi:hypothetical protein
MATPEPRNKLNQDLSKDMPFTLSYMRSPQPKTIISCEEIIFVTLAVLSLSARWAAQRSNRRT